SVQYGGDYSLYLRKQTLSTIATEYAHAGLWADVLKGLGDYLDAPTSQDYGYQPPMGNVLDRLAAQLASRPAGERYEALKTWTMPTPKRRMVRILSSVGSIDVPPSVFLGPKADVGGAKAGPAGHTGRGELVSTATALIEAAREAGALDALAA